MITDDTPEDRDRASTDAAPAKRPYLAPFLRHLDLEDSAGKTIHSVSKSPSTHHSGPS
jgi:hypothetical protein